MNRNLTTMVGALCVLGVSLACTSGPTRGAENAAGVDPRWSSAADPVLYARDGSVVQGASGGSSPASEPRHDVGARDGSRMYLLELYQRTVEEKEGLAREVQSLNDAVVRAGDTQRALEKERDDARQLAARLEQELERSRADNVDLAARLVTAQIRRLEAEKLVLEARIESMRREASSGTGAVSESSAAREHGKPKEAAAGGRP